MSLHNDNISCQPSNKLITEDGMRVWAVKPNVVIYGCVWSVSTGSVAWLWPRFLLEYMVPGPQCWTVLMSVCLKMLVLFLPPAVLPLRNTKHWLNSRPITPPSCCFLFSSNLLQQIRESVRRCRRCEVSSSTSAVSPALIERRWDEVMAQSGSFRPLWLDLQLEIKSAKWQGPLATISEGFIKDWLWFLMKSRKGCTNNRNWETETGVSGQSHCQVTIQRSGRMMMMKMMKMEL